MPAERAPRTCPPLKGRGDAPRRFREVETGARCELVTRGANPKLALGGPRVCLEQGPSWPITLILESSFPPIGAEREDTPRSPRGYPVRVRAWVRRVG
eukprot:scaffold4851_cov428-Prasinococcus_capsulatus_cf.AAC.1